MSWAFAVFALALGLALWSSPLPVYADGLPDQLAPAAPFPLVLDESFEQDFVAPGVSLGRYYMITANGPLVIHALSVDLARPALRIDTVLSDDHLISKGETVSSMAQRTQAVAGMNGDFFDIGSTYQPIGMLMHAGALWRSPTGRAALAITADHQTIFANFRYTGELSDDDGRTWSLTGMNVWPPQGGVALLSDVLGTLPPQPDTVLVPVTQISADRYQVLDAAAAATQPQTVPLAFAFGPAALQQNTPPAVGDMLTVSAQIEPPLSGIVSAIGGGPLLVHDGALCDDPLPPAPGEALVAVPLSGALRQRDGTLLLVEVDGRAPMVSVGLTRPAFAALLLAFGAVDGMAFDGGGSSTLVARLPGDTLATLQNTPSDGHERDVSDGIFVYDDTPVGPPARLALRHFPRRMFEGARAPLEVVVTDAAGHVLDDASPAPVQVTLLPATMGHVDTNGDLVADAPALAGTLHVDRGPLSLDTPLTVLDHLATLRIEPPSPNPAPGKTIALRAVAFDASGAPIDVDGSVQWSAPGASIRADGVYHAGTQDGSVVAQVAGQQVATLVRVGQRDLPIDVFRQDAADARAWSFTSLPVAQPGAVEIDDDDALALSYDFTGSERAAYADADIKIAGDLLALSLDVQGDGSGAALRVAVTTADGDRLPITLAAHVDWQGWRRLTVRMPHEAVSPLTLDGFYLVASPSGPEPPPPGAIALRNLHGIFAGTSTPNPPYRLE